MSCKIHGRTCSGDHASDVPPSRDGISLRSRAHTLTATAVHAIPQSQGRAFELDFAAIRVGIALYPGMSPLEVRDQLMRMCRMIEREFGIEIDTNQATTKSHTRYGAQKS